MNNRQLVSDRAILWPRASLALRPVLEHCSVVALYCLLGVALSWPLVRDFSSLLISDSVDARHNLWGFWHVLQVLGGREPLYATNLLYYPQGISLLVHGVGPLTGLFALPFWPWGSTAAYNGALLVSLLLSGYCTYLLGRDLGFARPIAWFAGLVVLASPITIAGLESHVTKVFLGSIPLALLVTLRALDRQRPKWWALLVGPALLLVLLHNGYQFVFASLAIGFFGLLAFAGSEPGMRWPILQRGALMLLSALCTVGPLLLAISMASQNPAITVDVNADSVDAPDLLHFLLPPAHSLLFGDFTRRTLATNDVSLALLIERSVGLPLVVLLLSLCACWSRNHLARHWLLLSLLCVLFALGPNLHIAGQSRFTEYELPLALPYAFLTGLPGLDFMRSPGRFMMLGFVAWAITAAYGLQWLGSQCPQLRPALLVGASSLLLLQLWPQPRLQEALGTTPAFYQQLANDPEQYGVFDLPLKPDRSLDWTTSTIFYSSYYQTLQMTHGKGIAGGYISRTYDQHPLFSELISPQPTPFYVNDRLAAWHNFQHELARHNYRYVVLHKTIFAASKGSDEAVQAAQELLAVAFAGQAPLLDNADITVYRVDPPAQDVQLHVGSGWRFPEPEWRWAISPATLLVEAPQPVSATLELTPLYIHDPAAPTGIGAQGTLEVQVGNTTPFTVPLLAGQIAAIPVRLEAGQQTISLRLLAGNFAPSAFGGNDDDPLSFAVQRLNLRTNYEPKP
jgi:uncharacterized membrane protein YhaH (DUF805 family)